MNRRLSSAALLSSSLLLLLGACSKIGAAAGAGAGRQDRR